MIYKLLGNTDEVTTCDQCGRAELKGTVELEDEFGNVVHFGSVCAAVALGRGSTAKAGRAVMAEAEANRRAAEELVRREHQRALCESQAKVRAIFNNRQAPVPHRIDLSPYGRLGGGGKSSVIVETYDRHPETGDRFEVRYKEAFDVPFSEVPALMRGRAERGAAIFEGVELFPRGEPRVFKRNGLPAEGPLSIVDTRQFEHDGGRWRPVPGTGEPVACHCCRRGVVIHARFGGGPIYGVTCAKRIAKVSVVDEREARADAIVRGELARRREAGKPTDIRTVTRAMLGHWAGFDLADKAIEHAIWRLADRAPLKPNDRTAAAAATPAPVMGQCVKRAGKGRIRGYEHIHKGYCFACGGTGKIDATPRAHPPAPRLSDEEMQRSDIAQLKALYDGAAMSRPGADRDAWAAYNPRYGDTAETVGHMLAEIRDPAVRRHYIEGFKRLDLLPEWYDRANAHYKLMRGPKANGAVALFGAPSHRRRTRRGRR